jgi:hypothetical protein
MKISKQVKAVVEAWATEICHKADILDPDNQLDWESMWIGFAIGKGLSINDAANFYDLAFEKEGTRP